MSLSKQIESQTDSYIFNGKIQGEDARISRERTVWKDQDGKSSLTPDKMTAKYLSQFKSFGVHANSSFKGLRDSIHSETQIEQTQLELRRQTDFQYMTGHNKGINMFSSA